MSLIDRNRPVSDQCEKLARLIEEAYHSADFAIPGSAPRALGQMSAYGTILYLLVPRIRDMERRLAEAEDAP